MLKALKEVIVRLVQPENFLITNFILFWFQGQLDEALEILNKTMEKSKEQREIGLLCYYDKGRYLSLFRVHFRMKYQEVILFICCDMPDWALI